MTEVILIWELAKKYFRDTEPYGWALTIVVMFAGWWLVWRKTRRLTLFPHVEPIYQAIIDLLTFAELNGHTLPSHYQHLSHLVKTGGNLFRNRTTVRRFLQDVLERGGKICNGRPSEDAKEWAKREKKRAERIFKRFRDV